MPFFQLLQLLHLARQEARLADADRVEAVLDRALSLAEMMPEWAAVADVVSA